MSSAEWMDKTATTEVTLAGDVTARLTAEERTKWAEHCLSSVEYEDLMVARHRLKAIVSVGAPFDDDDLRRKVRDETDATLRMHAAARMWVADFRARKRTKLVVEISKEQCDALLRLLECNANDWGRDLVLSLRAAKWGDSIDSGFKAAIDAIEKEKHQMKAEAGGLANSVFMEIEAERKFQDARWGGPAHDDEHTLEEWAHFMNGRVSVLAGAGHSEARRDLIEVAALAVAAIESLDRKEGK